MGFPSPAQDYVEQRISLDELCVSRPAATYFMRADQDYIRAGILKGSMLVIDSAVKPFDGSIVIATIGGSFFIRKLQLHPEPCLLGIDKAGKRTRIDLDSTDETEPTQIFGVMTYCVNDMRTAEFDDTPYGLD